MERNWVIDLFLKHGDIFLKIMNERWKTAEEEAKAIARVFKKHGLENGKILDLMCGNGRIAINLARLDYEVVGVDISPLYIEDARRRAKEHRVEEKVKFLAGDVRNLKSILKPFGEQFFDAVINVWTSIGFFDEKTDEAIFTNARKYSKDDALLVIAGCASRDQLLRIFSRRIWEEIGDIIILHDNELGCFQSRLKSTWYVYEKSLDKKLSFIGKLTLNLRLYSVHEILSILNRASWSLVEAYGNIINMTPFGIYKPLNLVLKAI